LGNPGALQAKVQQEQKGRPGLAPDLRDLLALQAIQDEKDAYARQMAMGQLPQGTVADQLIQAVKQPLPEPGQAMPQGMPPGMPQGAPQGMPPGMPQRMPQGLPQGLPQGMAPSMAPAPQPGLQQLPSNIGQHLSGGGIVAFAEGEEVLSQRDQLRRMEAAYNPAVTEALMNANTVPMASTMPAEDIQRARAILSRGMNQNPEQAEAELIRKYAAQVGNRDTSQYDRLIAEYESRKKQLEGPKPGIDSLMEYLGMVAATPRGRSWTEAGSMAARAQNDLNAQRQSQQFELTKQGLEAAQKKADIIYGEKKDLFGAGRAAYDQAYKANYEAALKVTGNAFEAEKLATEVTQKYLDRVSTETMAKERNRLTAASNANQAAYNKGHLELEGRKQDLAELTKPTAGEIMFNRIMGKVNQDPEIKGLAKRLDNEDPGSDQYRQVQKMMHEKMKTYFANNPTLLPPLAEMTEIIPPVKEPGFFDRLTNAFKSSPENPAGSKPSNVLKFDAQGNLIKG
jgi:hypothetical protein